MSRTTPIIIVLLLAVFSCDGSSGLGSSSRFGQAAKGLVRDMQSNLLNAELTLVLSAAVRHEASRVLFPAEQCNYYPLTGENIVSVWPAYPEHAHLVAFWHELPVGFLDQVTGAMKKNDSVESDSRRSEYRMYLSKPVLSGDNTWCTVIMSGKNSKLWSLRLYSLPRGNWAEYEILSSITF